MQDREWVTELLMDSTTTCPAELVEEVMADARCVAFGPVHHYIAGAVLLACWRNAQGASNRDELLRKDLEKMMERSDCVPGASCAHWGVCGAAASVGMAYSIVRGNAPTRDEGWQDAQLLVSKLLADIAHAGSPRCCKRDVRVAIREAVGEFNSLGGPQLEAAKTTPICETNLQNSVCLGPDCPYHP